MEKKQTTEAKTATKMDRYSGVALLALALAVPIYNSTTATPPKRIYSVPARSVFDSIGINDAKHIREKRIAYIKQFHHVAQAEQQKYGVPASITLAQGMLESENGTSNLAVKNKNHFGIKCFSKGCKKGHCTNHSDDSHKDFFRKYTSNWESFRHHSKVLTSERYRSLIGKPAKDWIWGLKKRGYATDKRYPQKLRGIIDEYRLTNFDNNLTDMS